MNKVKARISVLAILTLFLGLFLGGPGIASAANWISGWRIKPGTVGLHKLTPGAISYLRHASANTVRIVQYPDRTLIAHESFEGAQALSVGCPRGAYPVGAGIGAGPSATTSPSTNFLLQWSAQPASLGANVGTSVALAWTLTVENPSSSQIKFTPWVECLTP